MLFATEEPHELASSLRFLGAWIPMGPESSPLPIDRSQRSISAIDKARPATRRTWGPRPEDVGLAWDQATGERARGLRTWEDPPGKQEEETHIYGLEKGEQFVYTPSSWSVSRSLVSGNFHLSSSSISHCHGLSCHHHLLFAARNRNLLGTCVQSCFCSSTPSLCCCP